MHCQMSFPSLIKNFDYWRWKQKIFPRSSLSLIAICEWVWKLECCVILRRLRISWSDSIFLRLEVSERNLIVFQLWTTHLKIQCQVVAFLTVHIFRVQCLRLRIVEYSTSASVDVNAIMSSSSASGTHNFKIVLLGEGAVGKTSIVLRYVEDKFNDKHVSTLQVRFSQWFLKLMTNWWKYSNRKGNSTLPLPKDLIAFV